MRDVRVFGSAVSHGVAILAIQVISLLTLAPPEFGRFSLVYLSAAFVLSVNLSVVCEPWLRTAIANAEQREGWTDLSSAALYVAAIGGGAAGAGAVFVPDMWRVAPLVALAVLCGTYRQAARFYDAYQANWRRVVVSDIVTGVSALSFGASAYTVAPGDLHPMIGAWALSLALGALASRRPHAGGPASFRSWLRRHRRSIRVLLRDSLAMDATAIGTPFALSPVLGLAGLGVFRAVSNVAAPVRLIINPLRPRIGAMHPTHIVGARLLVLTVIAGSTIGGGVFAALLWISVLNVEIGTLSGLAEFAVPTGVFVAANLLGYPYYIAARHRSSGQYLAIGRVTQMALGIGGTVGAALAWDLNGAIWGYALCTLASSMVWVWAGRKASDAHEPLIVRNQVDSQEA